MADNHLAPWGYENLPKDYALEIWHLQLLFAMTLGAYVWDTVISLLDDCEFIFQRRFNYVTVLFIVNRLSTIIIIAFSWLYSVHLGAKCDLYIGIGVYTEPFSILTTQALLLIRVWVLYRDSRFLVIFLFLLMLAGPPLEIVGSSKLSSYNFPGNRGCGTKVIGTDQRRIYLVFLAQQAIFDCLCFFLCIYKLVRIGQGGGLMNIGREMLKGGVVYYIPNVIMQLAAIVLIAENRSVAGIFVPLAAFATGSAQALRVTRNLWKSGVDEKARREDSMNTPMTGIASIKTCPSQTG